MFIIVSIVWIFFKLLSLTIHMKPLILNLVYDSEMISGFCLKKKKKKGDSLVQVLVYPCGSVALNTNM